MIDKFLNAKHWQLFLLTFGLPVIFQITVLASMFMSNGEYTEPNSTLNMSYFILFSMMMLIFMGAFFGWFWSVAIGLQKTIPTGVKLKVDRFKIFLVIPVVYILFFLGYFMTSFTSGGPNPGIFAIIVPLHLFSMFCIFYCLHFVAKTFKTAELQRNVAFNDFAGEFFMIWFYPIGIWIIQPKINKMINEKAQTANNS